MTQTVGFLPSIGKRNDDVSSRITRRTGVHLSSGAISRRASWHCAFVRRPQAPVSKDCWSRQALPSQRLELKRRRQQTTMDKRFGPLRNKAFLISGATILNQCATVKKLNAHKALAPSMSASPESSIAACIFENAAETTSFQYLVWWAGRNLSSYKIERLILSWLRMRCSRVSTGYNGNTKVEFLHLDRLDVRLHRVVAAAGYAFNRVVAIEHKR
jgi:hypothetical protein